MVFLGKRQPLLPAQVVCPQMPSDIFTWFIALPRSLAIKQVLFLFKFPAILKYGEYSRRCETTLVAGSMAP